MITVYGAMAAGQPLLTLDDPSGMLRFIVIAILTSLALVPVALTRSAPPILPDIASFGLRRLYEASPLASPGPSSAGSSPERSTALPRSMARRPDLAPPEPPCS